MTRLFDYQNNINLSKTPNGDIVITMNEAILTAIINHINDASEWQRDFGMDATADDTKFLWRTLCQKHEQMNGEQ